jgi:hypothetical protein
MIATTSISHDSSLGLSYTDYTINDTLQGLILSVVDAIIEQDSTDRGAWTRVVTKRVALDSAYSEAEVTREIERMLKAGTLYESCYEILFGTFHMTYLRNSAELKSFECVEGGRGYYENKDIYRNQERYI